jgi:hypothetical protein
MWNVTDNVGLDMHNKNGDGDFFGHCPLLWQFYCYWSFSNALNSWLFKHMWIYLTHVSKTRKWRKITKYILRYTNTYVLIFYYCSLDKSPMSKAKDIPLMHFKFIVV